MPTDDEERRRRKRKEEEEKRRQRQRMLQKQRQRSLHRKHKERRKKDCMIRMPFIIAFHGDPARLFYCNDMPDSFELIPRTRNYDDFRGSLARLRQYMRHYVVSMTKKVLIYKAA